MNFNDESKNQKPKKISVQEKLEGLNNCGISEIHDAITFENGKLIVQLQVGHPNEEGSVSGCFPTHLVESVIKLHEHYNTVIPSYETEMAIIKFKKGLEWLNARAKNRKDRGVLQTDQK